MRVIVFGRASEPDVIKIDDTTVSRHHVQIVEHDNGEYELIDLGSRNGTFVNGRRVNQLYITRRDVIRIGNVPLPWRKYFETNITAEENKIENINSLIKSEQEDSKSHEFNANTLIINFIKLKKKISNRTNLFYIFYIVSIVGLIGGLFFAQEYYEFSLFYISLGLLFVTGIISMSFIYSVWASLEGINTMNITPQKAIGFMFIPIYNYYWIFIVYRRFYIEANLYTQSKIAKLGLPTTFVIFTFLPIIPINVILILFLIADMKRIANVVIDFRMAGLSVSKDYKHE